MANVNYTVELLLKANNQITGELTKVQEQIGRIEGKVNSTSGSVNSALSLVKKGIGALGLTALFTKVSKSVVTLGDNLEKAQLAFTTMLGSAEKAEILLSDLSDFAKKTPFELTGVRENAKQLLAMGIQADSIVPTLKALGDVSAGLNVDLSRIALNYGQVSTQMKLTGAELKDFTRMGVPLIQELAKNLNVAEADIQDMVKAGQIGFADVEKAFQTMTSEGGKFENLMSKQATTLSGLWSNFQDTLDGIGEEIGSNLLPTLKGYVEQISAWVEGNKDQIIYVAGEVVATIKSAADAIIGIIDGIGGVLSGLSSMFTDLMNGMLSDTNEGLSGMAGDWSDFFYIVQQGLTGIGKSLQLVMNTIGSVIKTMGKKTFWQGLDEAMFGNDKIGIGATSGGLKETRQYLKTAFSETKDVAVQGANDLVSALEENYINKVERTLNKGAKQIAKSGSLGSLLGGGGGGLGGGGGGGGSGASDALKKIKEVYKSITKDVDDQYDSIIKLNKEREKGFKELEKNLDDVDKTIENLKGNISDLRKSLTELGKSETSDVATEFVNARKELQKMERDYAGIGAVASQYSLDYLENYAHGGIGQYDIDALIQYKKYSDEMASVYDGLNASERQAMDEQIAYQEWYQSLNGIEKIKEDYRIKREEIQLELDATMSALREEELKRAEIDKQMQQYHKDWQNAVHEEAKKRAQMYQEKMEYEKMYQEQLEIDHAKQTEMHKELMRQLREIIALQQEAGTYSGGGSGTRAAGGPVYSGQQYLVGENGPEMFIPSQNGRIVRNEDLGRGQEFTINVNMGGVVVNDNQDISVLADEVASTITRQLELYKKGIY